MIKSLHKNLPQCSFYQPKSNPNTSYTKKKKNNKKKYLQSHKSNDYQGNNLKSAEAMSLVN